MNILIAVASRHGSTREIGERLATTLRRRGERVDLVDIDADTWLDDEHDAYVVGSAVYMDRWVRPARQFLRENALVLTRHPLWLFSSGPLDDADLPEAAAPSTGATALGERDHRVFAGALHRDDLGPLERTVVRAVGAHEGDYRDWDEIDAWANDIADDLRPMANGSSTARGASR